MAKLVLLSAGMAGRTHELKADKTTIGRVEDNTIQIAEPSVSSHHCELFLIGNDVVVKDLSSTNGTFINGEKVTETILKPGQTLRLGQIELRLEPEGGAAASAAAGAAATPAAASAGSKKQDTMGVQRGVKLGDLEQGRQSGFDPSTKGFAKKDDKINKIFIIVGIVLGVVILVLLAFLVMSIGK